jgi:hypothetical protein
VSEPVPAEPTAPAAAETDPAEVEDRKTEFSPSRIATASFIFFLIAYLLFLLSRVILPDQWEFALEVETEVASIELQPGVATQWRIDGAILCTTGAVALEAVYALEDEALEGERSICGGQRWSGWRVDLPEQVITIRGGSQARMALIDGRLSVSLRSEAPSLGEFEAVGAVGPVALGNAANLFWDLDSQSAALNFPFTGSTTLGRAVSWSNGAMLRSGSVAVFTADESADRRTQVDEAELMLGDQVTLAQAGDEADADAADDNAEAENADGEMTSENASEAAVWPKGFIRVGEEKLLEVVAFGRADSLSINRYGDSGYDFRPGFLARIASDPQIAFWGSILIAYMSVLFALIPSLDEKSVKRNHAPRLLRWLMRYRD